MKNLKLFVMPMIMLFLLPIFAQEKLNPSQLDYVGQEHNIGLNEFMGILKSKTNSGEKKISKSEVVLLLNNYLKSKVDDLKLDVQSSNAINNVINDVTAFKIIDNPNFITLLETGQEFKNQLILLDETINKSTDLDNLNKSLNEYVSKVQNSKLTFEELTILYGVVSTAKYSGLYWSSNLNEWNLYLNSSSQSRGWGSLWNGIKKMASDDAKGAIAGAVGAAAVNVIIGPGQVAYGAAIIAGGVGNSVLGVFD